MMTRRGNTENSGSIKSCYRRYHFPDLQSCPSLLPYQPSSHRVGSPPNYALLRTLVLRLPLLHITYSIWCTEKIQVIFTIIGTNLCLLRTLNNPLNFWNVKLDAGVKFGLGRIENKRGVTIVQVRKLRQNQDLCVYLKFSLDTLVSTSAKTSTG